MKQAAAQDTGGGCMKRGAKRKRRGSTLVESALALASFAVLLGGIMQAAFALLVANSITFAAERAARYASLSGSKSGHPAAAADIQSVAKAYAGPLSARALTANVTWTPDNQPGSTVQVQVSFSFQPEIVPLSSRLLTLQSTARNVIVQ
jgi:Flp pilus assembly protein TadG